MKGTTTCTFFFRPEQPSDTTSAKSAGVSDATPDLSNIPEDYHEFADVFSKGKAETLPDHRSFDLKIDIEEGSGPPVGPLYSLSQVEQKALKEFIDEHLRTGFIRSSKSPHGAPVLFAKKKDGSLRLCVDYRGLNKITRKDRYPLPRTSDLLDAPSKAKVYTKIDLRNAYHLVRIAEGDEWKTTFRTRYGSFEWLVMPFGLTNAPAAFQRMVNDIFSDMLDVCVIVYLDDILIFSDDMSKHKEHVKEVLRRLRKHKLYAKGEKCEFHTDTVEYLGYLLSPDGLKMDPRKIEVIQNWPEPRKVKEVQSFLGFANFYRRFIENYSDIVVPLTRLTRKNVAWVFSEDCRRAFKALKLAFTTAPILSHWIPDCPIVVETDASDYALGAIISIYAPDGEIHPVAFHSRTFSGAELNYDVHDKELLAIFEAFTVWRHYLEGAPTTIDVVTDHKNLEYFSTSKVLTRRQVRWSEYLSQFNLCIRYRPGKLGEKPDALTRRHDVYARAGNERYAQVNPQNFRPIFLKEQLVASIRATILLEPCLRASELMDMETLIADIRSSYTSDPVTAKDASEYTGRWSIDESGLIRLDNRIYVPDNSDLRLRILRFKHDHILSGHYGKNKTLELVRREFTWPKIREFITHYCKSCVTCMRVKPQRHKPYGLLRQLPVPIRPWDSISMDFIEKLPKSSGYDAILVIVDRLSKQAIFTPCYDTTTSEQL
ncbi:hypothetical protein ONZ45_g18712 [Pleurotus djamor]|nr:hypothetical protein ONZ45_g18712 [Pleurotus djamor]